MHADLYLRTSATDPRKVEKMYDFVRARIRKEAHLREIEVDEYDFEGNKTVPSPMSRKQWSPDDEVYQGAYVYVCHVECTRIRGMFLTKVK